MTWGGRTADSQRSDIHVFETVQPIPEGVEGSDAPRLMEQGADVTNDWIAGPAGRSKDAPLAEAELPGDPRRVMVVHGRNNAARAAMFIFLRAIGLDPIEWEDAIEATRLGSPHNLTAVRAAMDLARAVVVVLTAEDRAGLIPELAEAGSVETLLQGQPRQNVTLEAGMAIGIDPARTILVQLGAIRGASDFDGLNRVNLGNDAESRRALVRRLKTAGCAVSDDGADWLSPAGGGDFDASVVVADADTAPALDDVMAIPTTDMRGGQRAELNVRCFRLPDDAAVVCAVTHPGGETLETQAPGQSVGNDQTLHTAVYPESFPNAPVMAGHHTVNWVALSADGRERRELVTTDFRFP